MSETYSVHHNADTEKANALWKAWLRGSTPSIIEDEELLLHVWEQWKAGLVKLTVKQDLVREEFAEAGLYPREVKYDYVNERR